MGMGDLHHIKVDGFKILNAAVNDLITYDKTVSHSGTVGTINTDRINRFIRNNTWVQEPVLCIGFNRYACIINFPNIFQNLTRNLTFNHLER